MHDDDDRTAGPGPPRRWTPHLRAGSGARRSRSHTDRSDARTAIVISIDCPTPGCSGRLHFGAVGDAGGLTADCATCLRPFALVGGDVVERRRTSDAARQEDPG